MARRSATRSTGTERDESTDYPGDYRFLTSGATRHTCMPHLAAYLLPELVSSDDLAGHVVVAVDVLRATTTIIHALANGALEVQPVLTVEEARSRTAGWPGALLGGERGGKQIEGFHLGNSPAEYTPEKVRDRTLVFTTTNGTRALQHSRKATKILVGAFVNFTAICRELQGVEKVAVVCAGTDRQITREDVLFAGAVTDELCRSGGYELNDQAEIAADAWRTAVRQMTEGSSLATLLRGSLGARNLIEIGQERDIEIAAQIDKFDIVPVFDPRSGLIKL